jgi:hypothetical protein
MSKQSRVPTPTEQSNIPTPANGTLDPENIYVALTLNGTDIPTGAPSPPTISPESQDHPTDGATAVYGVVVYTFMNADEFYNLDPDTAKSLAVVLGKGRTWAARRDRHTQRIELKKRFWPVNDYNTSLRSAPKSTGINGSDSKVTILDSPAFSRSDLAEHGLRRVTAGELNEIQTMEAYLKREAREKRRADRLSKKARDEEATLEESLADVTVDAPGTAS